MEHPLVNLLQMLEEEATAVKKEEPMYVRFDNDCCDGTDVESTQRNYLLDRLNSVRETKRRDLRKKYFLTEDAPMTAEALIAKIKAGKYTLDEKNAKSESWNPAVYISWRAPDEKPDQIGFEKAEKHLTEAFLASKDAIVVGTTADGLNTLNKFAEKTIH